MCTDLVTTRSLPFGFRSVNRKLQPRLVCNEHNGDGSRVKVGQLSGHGKRMSDGNATRNVALYASLARSLSSLRREKTKSERRNRPFGHDSSRKREGEKKNELSSLRPRRSRVKRKPTPPFDWHTHFRFLQRRCIIHLMRVWYNMHAFSPRSELRGNFRIPFSVINAPLFSSHFRCDGLITKVTLTLVPCCRPRHVHYESPVNIVTGVSVTR